MAEKGKKEKHEEQVQFAAYKQSGARIGRLTWLWQLLYAEDSDRELSKLVHALPPECVQVLR